MNMKYSIFTFTVLMTIFFFSEAISQRKELQVIQEQHQTDLAVVPEEERFFFSILFFIARTVITMVAKRALFMAARQVVTKVVQHVAKTAVKHVVKAVAKKVIKTAAKKVIKAGVKHVAKSALKKVGKTVLKSLAKKGFKSLLKRGLKKVSTFALKKLSKRTAKKMMKKFGKQIQKKLKKEAMDKMMDMITGEASTAVEEEDGQTKVNNDQLAKQITEHIQGKLVGDKLSPRRMQQLVKMVLADLARKVHPELIRSRYRRNINTVALIFNVCPSDD